MTHADSASLECYSSLSAGEPEAQPSFMNDSQKILVGSSHRQIPSDPGAPLRAEITSALVLVPVGELDALLVHVVALGFLPY